MLELHRHFAFLCFSLNWSIATLFVTSPFSELRNSNSAFVESCCRPDNTRISMSVTSVTCFSWTHVSLVSQALSDFSNKLWSLSESSPLFDCRARLRDSSGRNTSPNATQFKISPAYIRSVPFHVYVCTRTLVTGLKINVPIPEPLTPKPAV